MKKEDDEEMLFRLLIVVVVLILMFVIAREQYTACMEQFNSFWLCSSIVGA